MRHSFPGMATPGKSGRTGPVTAQCDCHLAPICVSVHNSFDIFPALGRYRTATTGSHTALACSPDRYSVWVAF
jgi:hypothetical protein